MKAYTVHYKMSPVGVPHFVSLLARNKEDAFDKAVFEEIPRKEGTYPFSAWVSSVTYNNGNCKYFNTFEGNPY